MAMPLVENTIYCWASPDLRVGFSSLLPRKRFKTWFHALFFRLALPFPQNPLDNLKVIVSPLNLIVLFYLIPQLHKIGYPAHWLSEVLTSILSGSLRTTARPPRVRPLTIEDLEKDHPDRSLCVAPFAPELAVIARLFQPILPFSLPSTVPAIDKIH